MMDANPDRTIGSWAGSFSDQAEDFNLSEQEVAFLRGVFAARGIAAPTEAEFEEAMELLHWNRPIS